MKLFLLLPLVAATFPDEEGSHLPKEVREKLEKQFGTDLKTRFENLRKIGYEYRTSKENEEMDIPSKGRKGDLSIWKINQRAGVAKYLWDGDINLTQEQIEKIKKSRKEEQISADARDKRQAVENFFKKWRNRKVYYYFEDHFGNYGRYLVKKVVDFFEKNTCIRFEENSTVIDRIKIVRGNECSSDYGMAGGEQYLTLGQGCWTFGIVAHEILHALGFLHTQARPDRDDFVSVIEENINSTQMHNFYMAERYWINIYTPYDYASIMHYPPDGFSIDDKIGIIAKDYRFAFSMGSDWKLTFYDLKALNELYMCTVMYPPKVSAKCSNGGYPNPNKRSVCICPDGYGSQFCNERPPGCGSSLVATSKWQEATIFVNISSTTLANGNLLQCHDWITAPNGKYVEVKIQSLGGASCEYGCNGAALEIKLESPEATSPRLCCNSLVNSTYVSKLNPTPVIAFTSEETVRFRYQYRFVDEAPQPKEIDPMTPPCTDELATCPKDESICFTEKKIACPVTCNICPK